MAIATAPTHEKIKEKLAMEYHTTRRVSFDQGTSCCAGDKEEWKATVKGGLVFSLALVQTLRSANNFISGHIKDTRVFQERVSALSLEATEQRKAI
jgi:hypothetical protein